MMEPGAILVGGFHDTIELCELCGVRIVGIIDNTLSGTIRGYHIWGGDSVAADIFQGYGGTPVVLSPDSPRARRALADLYGGLGFQFLSLISPRATVSSTAKLGRGIVVQSGVNISSQVTVGEFVKINSCANIMHDSVISSFTSVAPNAVVLGRAVVGESCYIGANATILPEITLESECVVGAGAVVTKNIPAHTTVVGNPARRIDNKL